MSGEVLVAYATKNGSTREVAEVIAETIRQLGVSADLQTMRDVHTVDGYKLVVLGAPLYLMRWHKDAHRFLSRQRDKLAELPVAVFAGGPFHDDPKEFADVREQLDKELAKSPWLAPISIEIIGGKHDPEKLSFPWNLIPAIRQMPASDVRDWTAVRDWAAQLAGRLQQVGA